MRAVAFLLAGLTCACGATAPPRAEERVSVDDAAVARQLEGHLARARGCYDERRRRNRSLAGWVRVSFEVTPGDRSAASVLENTSGDPELATCIESRLDGLYFDPAPAALLSRVHDFVLCPSEDGDTCELNPSTAVSTVIAARASDLAACARSRGATSVSLLDIELRLEPDGRILSGRVRTSLPETTPARACGVGPILGARIPDLTLDAPSTYRITYLLRPATAAATASR